MKVGFVLHLYHTELLEFLFEIFTEKGYDLVLYIKHDNYDNVDLLKAKYRNLQVKTELQNDYNNNVCCRYFVLSHLSSYISTAKNMIYIVHNQSELDIVKKLKNVEYIVVSQSIEGKYLMPVNKSTIQLNRDETKSKAVMKIGWVMTADVSVYHELLRNGVHVYVFTQNWTPILQELSSMYGVLLHVLVQKTTTEIFKMIEENNIEYVLYNPIKLDLWSGSISFALNHNLTLITLSEIVKKYSIPKEIVIQYDTQKVIHEMAKNKINATLLTVYKHEIYKENKEVLASFKL